MKKLFFISLLFVFAAFHSDAQSRVSRQQALVNLHNYAYQLEYMAQSYKQQIYYSATHPYYKQQAMNQLQLWYNGHQRNIRYWYNIIMSDCFPTQVRSDRDLERIADRTPRLPREEAEETIRIEIPDNPRGFSHN